MASVGLQHRSLIGRCAYAATAGYLASNLLKDKVLPDWHQICTVFSRSGALGDNPTSNRALRATNMMMVFDDAHLEAVVAGIRVFGYYNAGQDCTAACRLYAGAKIYDRLVADLAKAVATIKVGPQREDYTVVRHIMVKL